MATAFCVAATFERCDAAAAAAGELELDAAGTRASRIPVTVPLHFVRILLTIGLALPNIVDSHAGANAADPAADAHAFRRLATAICKYQLCRRAPAVAFEAMEAHGGNGYVEEGLMGRLYRQAPLNAIWEGSGNVICLDVVRTLQREPRAGTAFLATLAAHRGCDARFDALMSSIGTTLESVASHSTPDGAFNVRAARHLVECLAAALQTHALFELGDAGTTEAWLRSRLAADGEHAGLTGAHGFGSFPIGAWNAEHQDALVERLAVGATGEGAPIDTSL